MKPALFNPGWLGELRLEKKGVRVKKTGALVSWQWGNLVAILRSIVTQTMIRTLALIVQLAPGRSYRIKFLPMKPAPWYLIWAVMQASKGSINQELHRADALFFFDDLTQSKHELGAAYSNTPMPKLVINQQCTDISKFRVEQVFARVFGYSLAIDPTTWQGKAVEKSDENGAHDGRIVDCPCQPVAGKVYERLIVNSDNGHTVLDYRSPTIGGEIPLVFIKERPINQRFANFNTKVRLVKTAQLFSPEELLLLSRFCREMGLDFGGLDVLRDREDGRIYVVDVNKTDMGPPTSLGFIDQFRALRILAAAFRKFVLLGLT
ncbi:MAG: hypothetical protein COA47_11970 [Robiginitomaculum sp.]|nr:MAG: hypothetical protein COA47_11970 [Robiginitomaculum sp.]